MNLKKGGGKGQASFTKSKKFSLGQVVLNDMILDLRDVYSKIQNKKTRRGQFTGWKKKKKEKKKCVITCERK